MNKKPQLLAPAGNFEKMKVAFHYGADAVYAGLDKLSLRANADNFTRDELREAVKYAHDLGKKIYLAINIFFTPEQSEIIIDALKYINEIQPDGMIISDSGLIFLARQFAPNIPVHLSTQANCTNHYAAGFYKEAGVKRIVLARELSIKEISIIRKEVPDIELETFIHGAMCIAYSGRCLLSSYMTTNNLGSRYDKDDSVRSANKGDCAHSCRWEFVLKEKSRANQNFEISEDENGTYILSSKDICMIEHLPDLINAGVDCFKIEGRMKSILYISSIVRAYRYVIDKYYENSSFNPVTDEVLNELNVVSHREFSTGFFYDSPMTLANTTDSIKYERNVRLAAMIIKSGTESELKLFNKLSVNDKIELIGKDMKTLSVGKIVLKNSFGEILDSANHTDLITASLFDKDNNLIVPEIFDILRIESVF